MHSFKDFFLKRKKTYDGLLTLQIKYGIQLPDLLIEHSRKYLPEILPDFINISIEDDICTGLVSNNEFIFFSGFIPDSDIEFALENDFGCEGQIHNFFKFAFSDSNQGGFFIDLNEADYGKIYSIENYDEREEYIEKNIKWEIITVADSFEEFIDNIHLYEVSYDSKEERTNYRRIVAKK